MIPVDGGGMSEEGELVTAVFPIEHLSPDQFELYIKAEQQKLERIDAELEFADAIAECMELHGHETVGDAIGCCWIPDDFGLSS